MASALWWTLGSSLVIALLSGSASGYSVCTNSPVNWSADNENCTDYALNQYCTVHGDYGVGWDQSFGTFDAYVYPPNNETPIDACCGCGGGITTEDHSCDNVPGWVDSYGDGCDVYATQLLCNNDGTPGPGWTIGWGALSEYANDGFDATTACCVCGKSNTDIYNLGDGNFCVDDPVGWVDSADEACDIYANGLCTPEGSEGPAWDDAWGFISDYSVNGTSASTACCVCGGGSTVTVDTNLYTDGLGECTDSDVQWRNIYGYGCAAYEALQYCLPNGTAGPGWVLSWGDIDSVTSINGTNAAEACCVCGGGATSAPSAPTASPTVSTPSPTTNMPTSFRPRTFRPTVSPTTSSTAEVCVPSPISWVDSDRIPCSSYDQLQLCNSTGHPGSGWNSSWGSLQDYAVDGVSAAEACCACGGGELIRIDTQRYVSSTSQCMDSPINWENMAGSTCLAYQAFQYCTGSGGEGPGWNSDWGNITDANHQDVFGTSATTACCICGGGTTDSPSAAPSAAPSIEPSTLAPTPKSPTSAPSNTVPTVRPPPCIDSPLNWTGSAYGMTCFEYAAYGYCDSSGTGPAWNTTTWGPLENRASIFGVSVTDACCECGGGEIPVEATQSFATDVCTNAPLEWNSIDNETCDDYAYYQYCTASGSTGPGWNDEWGNIVDFASSDGVSALDACCVCGGGKYISWSTDVYQGCYDEEDWATDTGETCGIFGALSFCEKDGSAGLGWDDDRGDISNITDTYGMTAGDACCACGGGTSYDSTPAPAFVEPVLCQNSPMDWTNTYNESCAIYLQYDYCTDYGTAGDGWNEAWGDIAQYGTNGITALDACCTCGGGTQITDPPEYNIDSCIDLSSDWETETGESCADFSRNQYCLPWGAPGMGWNPEWGLLSDQLGADRTSALETCCACGGGRTTTEFPPQLCQNEPVDWKNADNESCAIYHQYDYCNADGSVGDGWDLTWGVLSDFADELNRTALSACCTCGGGSAVTTPEPIDLNECIDTVDGWENSLGETCVDFGNLQYCHPWGDPGPGWDPRWGLLENQTNDAGISALEACCTCGGGGVNTLDPICADYPPSWVDVDGKSCADYASMEYCNAFGNVGTGWSTFWGSIQSYGVNGISAFDACCACGGGLDESGNIDDSSYEETFVCVNSPADWEVDGQRCHDYAYLDYCTSNGRAGPGWNESWKSPRKIKDENGISAADACCTCGGGRHVTLREIDEMQQFDGCTDAPDDWQASDGESCLVYQLHEYCSVTGAVGPGWHPAWGSFLDFRPDDGLPANVACCACGGGVDANGTRYTNVPISDYRSITIAFTGDIGQVTAGGFVAITDFKSQVSEQIVDILDGNIVVEDIFSISLAAGSIVATVVIGAPLSDLQIASVVDWFGANFFLVRLDAVGVFSSLYASEALLSSTTSSAQIFNTVQPDSSASSSFFDDDEALYWMIGATCFLVIFTVCFACAVKRGWCQKKSDGHTSSYGRQKLNDITMTHPASIPTDWQAVPRRDRPGRTAPSTFGPHQSVENMPKIAMKYTGSTLGSIVSLDEVVARKREQRELVQNSFDNTRRLSAAGAPVLSPIVSSPPPPGPAPVATSAAANGKKSRPGPIAALRRPSAQNSDTKNYSLIMNEEIISYNSPARDAVKEHWRQLVQENANNGKGGPRRPNLT